MEYKNGVIAIIQNGEVIISNINEINSRHIDCFIDIENKLGLSNCGQNQMEHSWYLARKGIISFQIWKDIVYTITSPENDMIQQIQREKLYDIIKNNFNDVENFSVDLVTNDTHRPVIIDGEYEYGIDGLNQIFQFDLLENHKTL